MDTTELLARANVLTNDLAGLHRERAMLDAAIIKQRAQVWHTSQENVTFRREQVAHCAADLQAELVSIEGDIRAATVELAHIDRVLAHASAAAKEPS